MRKVVLEEYLEGGIKVVVVGDGAVGKTSLLTQYCKNVFNPSYTPTIFDNMVARVAYNDRMLALNLWDTAGEEDYDTLRPLSYQETHVFLLAFDIMNRTSFANLRIKWHPEVVEYAPDHNSILVGCKSDLRDDESFREDWAKRRGLDTPLDPVSEDECHQMVKELECYAYCETSAKTRRGVDECFITALDSVYLDDREARRRRRRRRRGGEDPVVRFAKKCGIM